MRVCHVYHRIRLLFPLRVHGHWLQDHWLYDWCTLLCFLVRIFFVYYMQIVSFTAIFVDVAQCLSTLPCVGWQKHFPKNSRERDKSADVFYFLPYRRTSSVADWWWIQRRDPRECHIFLDQNWEMRHTRYFAQGEINCILMNLNPNMLINLGTSGNSKWLFETQLRCLVWR